ncbi:MAG: hypothetical protein AB1411_11620 [Nitrospirota bacterium]
MRGLLAGLLTFEFYFLLQTGLFHFSKVNRRACALVGLWLCGLPVYALFYAWVPDDHGVWPVALSAPSDSITFACGGLLYFFIFMGYAQFIYMAESSVGVRTMIELDAEPIRGLAFDEILKRYGYEWMIERRLRRMVHAGYLIEDKGYYRTTRRGRFVAAVLAWFKRFLRLGPGG